MILQDEKPDKDFFCSVDQTTTCLSSLWGLCGCRCRSATQSGAERVCVCVFCSTRSDKHSPTCCRYESAAHEPDDPVRTESDVIFHLVLQ